MADRNKEITLRLQYPKELAPVSECELDGLLAAMQKVSRIDVTCTCVPFLITGGLT